MNIIAIISLIFFLPCSISVPLNALEKKFVKGVQIRTRSSAIAIPKHATEAVKDSAYLSITNSQHGSLEEIPEELLTLFEQETAHMEKEEKADLLSHMMIAWEKYTEAEKQSILDNVHKEGPEFFTEHFLRKTINTEHTPKNGILYRTPTDTSMNFLYRTVYGDRNETQVMKKSLIKTGGCECWYCHWSGCHWEPCCCCCDWWCW